MARGALYMHCPCPGLPILPLSRIRAAPQVETVLRVIYVAMIKHLNVDPTAVTKTKGTKGGSEAPLTPSADMIHCFNAVERLRQWLLMVRQESKQQVTHANTCTRVHRHLK